MKLFALFIILIISVKADRINTQGNTVMGVKFDEVWVITFLPFEANNPQTLLVFDQSGQPRKSICHAAIIDDKTVLKEIKKLFSDKSAFRNNGLSESGLLLNGLVFYNNGKFVFAVLPNHVGMDVWCLNEKQERVSIGGFSERQIQSYDEIYKTSLELAFLKKTKKALPQIKR